MKGLFVGPCKGKKCLAICHVWLDALLARIAPYKQPATKNRQTVFPAHQRNEEAQVFFFQLFFKFPGKPLRDFYAEYSPHTNTATLNVFVCLPEFLLFLKLVVKSSLEWQLSEAGFLCGLRGLLFKLFILPLTGCARKNFQHPLRSSSRRPRRGERLIR